MRRKVTSVTLRFDDGSVISFEGFENGIYTQQDTWREVQGKPGLVDEKFVLHKVQWTSDRVKNESH